MLVVNFVCQNVLVMKSLLELKASLLYDAKKIVQYIFSPSLIFLYYKVKLQLGRTEKQEVENVLQQCKLLFW